MITVEIYFTIKDLISNNCNLAKNMESGFELAKLLAASLKKCKFDQIVHYRLIPSLITLDGEHQDGRSVTFRIVTDIKECVMDIITQSIVAIRDEIISNGFKWIAIEKFPLEYSVMRIDGPKTE